MSQNKKTADPSACVHCHLCQKSCRFLEKYQMDIGDIHKIEPLAYHCFLCGKCTQVCPKGIDGREIILNLRRSQVRENKGRVKEKGYAMLIKEKKDYMFQNYRNGRYKRVLFPGCNFPSFYPETTRLLADLLREKDEIGIVFDCCGKPVAELGMEEDAQKIVNRIDRKLQAMHVDELIMVCPNCYAYLNGRLNIKVVMIYDKLRELGIGEKIKEKIRIFPPCPDRGTEKILGTIRPFLEEEPEIITESQCCGLGGCAGQKEADLAMEMVKAAATGGNVCTYCASCSGSFARKGFDQADHILLKILGITEKPDTAKSMINRMKTKYWQGGAYGKKEK